MESVSFVTLIGSVHAAGIITASDEIARAIPIEVETGLSHTVSRQSRKAPAALTLEFHLRLAIADLWQSSFLPNVRKW
jgi:hypothetical protein